MPNSRNDWQIRIKTVEREYSAVRQSVDRLVSEIRHDPNILKGDSRPRDLGTASDRLEATYTIRIFAEFETGLGQFWLTMRKTKPPMKALVEAVAALRRVPEDMLGKVQKVRDYRNALIHEREERVDPMALTEVRKSLSRLAKIDCPFEA